MMKQRVVSSGRGSLEVKCTKRQLDYLKGLLTGRRGSVAFWAWIGSIAVHLIVLTAFGFIKFSQSQAYPQEVPILTAKVSRIKRLMGTSPIIPKPKIKKPIRTEPTGRVNASAVKLSVGRIFGAAKPDNQRGDLVKPSGSQSVYALPDSKILPNKIGFFGSFTDQRKACYLVDCSGSMQGVFRRVQRKLKESIGDLQADQYFYIIFFGGGRLFETGGGRLVRAGEESKSAAYEFIDSTRPAGRTNALAALERAVQIRDGAGAGSSVIYFLTDGFELTNESAQEFSRKAAELRKRFAPTTKINTIGFWPQLSDRRILEVIAEQSGGECVFIDDGSN
jgi:hypothetical protein